jgi:hypothetical protein
MIDQNDGNARVQDCVLQIIFEVLRVRLLLGLLIEIL